MKILKTKHIVKLSTALSSTGLGLFLIVGLNGCDVDDDCNKTWNNSKTPTNQTDECKQSRSHSYSTAIIPTGTSTHSSGFFSSDSSSSHSSSGGWKMTQRLKERVSIKKRLKFVLNNLNTHNVPYIVTYIKTEDIKDNSRIMVRVGVSLYRIKTKKCFAKIDKMVRNIVLNTKLYKSVEVF